MRILALVPGGIGDQILFFPTLDHLKQTYPNSEINVVAEPRATGAYRVCKSVDKVVPYDFKARNSLADWGNLLGIIRDREFDAVLSLGQRWTVSLLLWLTGVPVRIGYADSPGANFLTNTVPLNPNQYAAEMYHDLLKGLGINKPCPELSINIPARDFDWADAEQKRLGIPGKGYVLIHGGSSELAIEQGINKIYPVENWRSIIRDFQQKQPDLPIVLVQGPAEVELVADLLEISPNLKVTAPTDIGKLAALIAGASLMLCTDSAPIHLAVATQTFTLALFGPSDPKKVLPQSDRIAAIQSFTGKIEDIDPQVVLQKVWGG